MKVITKRLLATVLAITMLISALPMQSLAYMADKPTGLSFVDKDGKRITPTGDWETMFPYGTFAFENASVSIEEGGTDGVIKLYRLGGTKGRATAYVTYMPAIAEIEAGVKSYANAAGKQDITIKVEDPLPIAQYQPVGKDNGPLAPSVPVGIIVTQPTEDVADFVLNADVTADAYEWYLNDGSWKLLSDASEQTISMPAEDYDAYDFRCVYTIDGVQYGSTSAKGEAYQAPEQETLAPIPDDLPLNPKATYTTLPMDDKDPYAGYVFDVTFAEGEWVKEIHVSSPEDTVSEPDKFGVFTIIDCEGGSLYDTANTFTLHIADNDKAQESQIGFDITDITVDKSAGSALLTVVRTGGNQTVLTLDYETKDGTAVAGTDYSAAKGSLMFYGDILSQTIEIPLINDGIVSEDLLDFTVTLSGLKGDADNLCTLGATEAKVSLFNTNTATEQNLATILHDGEAIDASGNTPSSEPIISTDKGPIVGEQTTPDSAGEALVAEIVPTEQGDVSTLSYQYSEALSFKRTSGYNGWKDKTAVGTQTGGEVDKYNDYISSWSGGSSNGNGWKHESKGPGYAYLRIPNMGQLYNRFEGNLSWTAALASAWTLFWYGMEFTYPWFEMRYSNQTYRVSSNISHWIDGLTFYISPQYSGGSANRYFDMGKYDGYLYLGTSHHDAHDSDKNAVAALQNATLTRRIFNNKINLKIHTANDGYNGTGSVATAPPGAAALAAGSGVYGDGENNGGMKPQVSIVSGQGGFNSAGQLYVGSKLDISLRSTASYSPATSDSNLNTAVYLTNQYGTVVKSTSGSGNSRTLELLWDSLTESGLNDTYTLNVVMTRKQKISLDIGPSVPRKTDDNGNPLLDIDPNKVNTAWNDFWKGNNKITYGYSEIKGTAPHFTSSEIKEKSITQDLFAATNLAQKILNNPVENLQWINFNRSAEDVIVYNGRQYAGNEKIWLDVADLALGSMIFRYYQKDYLTAKSTMNAHVSQTALFLDGNGNGRIDGYFNKETGYFVVDTSVKDEYGNTDEFLYYLDPDTDYDESIFAPVPVFDKQGKIVDWRQYFLKSFYTMTPRALMPPADAKPETERAQVLPAFITDVTDPATFSELTREQQAYRYIISGKNRAYTNNQAAQNDADYARSADNHIMYGAEATAVSVIDIPLGGDMSPPQKNPDGKTFSWNPKFGGNLLYEFANPEPVLIPKSLAGDNIPISEDFEVTPENGLVWKDEGVKKINQYLGSFTGNDTYRLCVQEQVKTTDDIAKENKVTGGITPLNAAAQALSQPTPESVTIGESGCFPNSDYLKTMDAGGDTNSPNLDMDSSGNEYPEYNIDMGVKMPSTDIEVTDFVTIILDEYEVGFSIGLPLGGYNSDGDAGSGGPGSGSSGSGSGTQDESNWVSPKKAYASAGEDMGKLKDFLKKPSKDTIQGTDDSYKNAKNGGGMKSSSFEVSFSISLAFLFKYNAIDNGYYFSQFSLSFSAELEYTYQQRITPVPIVYLYIKVGIGIEIGTGATVEREVVEAKNPETLTSANNTTGTKYGTYVLNTNKKAFNITFKGKLGMEVFTDASCTTPAPGFSKGYIQSDGQEPMTIILKEQKGMDMDKAYYVRFIAMTETELTRIVKIDSVATKSYWSGVSLSPEAFLEAGAGIGVEILKFEIFVKVNIGCGMTLGAYNKDTDSYDPFSFDEFEFGLGLGFRVVLLIFSYEMDLIQYKINYDGETDKWTHSWAALGGLFGDEIGELSAVDSQGNTYGVRIRLPGSAADTQTVYSGDMSIYGGVETLAYNPNDKEVPFQLSGYGSTGDAFKLADGMLTGYDYKVITVGTENFIIYTISREGAANEVDNTMLVLSRLQLTQETDPKTGEIRDSYGLVNPVDVTNTATPYIILDDDGTGDLSFSAWVDGTDIHAAWVSYATVSAKAPTTPKKPDGAPYNSMDESNYLTMPAPTAPSVVTEPIEPVESAYYVSATDWAALSTTEQAKYTQDVTDTTYYYITSYTTYALAKTAYDNAVNIYNTAKGKYDQYLLDKAAYDTAIASYTEWHTYFTASKSLNDYIQARAANAAKNTVIKTASFDTTQSTGGFTNPTVVSGLSNNNPVVGSHVFLPKIVNENVAVYGKATHYTPAELQQAISDYDAYLLKAFPDSAGTAMASTRAYRALLQKGQWEAYGKASSIAIATDKGVTELALAAGQILENMEVTEIGGTYYVAYTTGQMTYMDNDMLNTRRMYLRTFTVDSGTGIVTWGNSNKATLLRTLVDYEKDNTKDGIYSGSTLTATYGDPYFANLQFLTGKLGAIEGTSENFTTLAEEQPEPFLLFEMNGSTFVIPKQDLIDMTASDAPSGRIIPFFAPAQMTNADGSKATPTSTGRAEVTIGADGAGNISAVYVSPVIGTTNNALYLSKWDPTSKTWGTGTMLAMNYMQVYEDSKDGNWSMTDAEEAYLGKRSGYAKGGMDQFVFSNMQIALGQKATVSGASVETLSGETASISSVPAGEIMSKLGIDLGVSTLSGSEEGIINSLSTDQIETMNRANTGNKDTLLVITEGSLRYLTERKVSDTETILAPMSDSAALAKWKNDSTLANRKPGVGFYAVSYGVGGQAIGEGTLSLYNYDFTVGSRLDASFSFVNTGDVGIRGSDANPITVKLLAGNQELGKWLVKKNITAGEKAVFSGKLEALASDLPTGTEFSIAVSEDSKYIGEGNAFVKSIPVLTVEEKAELGFESFSTKAIDIDAEGNTVLDVNFQVGNRGNKLAEDVFVQFSYENGEDVEGKPIYTPLNITGNTLKVSKQETLTTLSTGGLETGIFPLYNAEDGDDIAVNKGRTVEGTITVPPSGYRGKITGSLNLRVEMFSKESKVTSVEASGQQVAEHNEYNTVNNVQFTQIEHKTNFTAANKITLAMGNTLRLPVSLAVSTGKDAVVSVEEIIDGNDTQKNLGILYYADSGVYTNGHGSGTIIIAPSREGDGIIHLMDRSTNTIYPITFTVTKAEAGINIFKDNNLFTFKNADNSVYDSNKANQSWQFLGGVSEWGVKDTPTEKLPAPYLADLSRGKPGASFTFTTVAKSIDLYFNGKVEVTSTWPGFWTRTIEAKGKNTSARVTFGENPTNIPHDVTIRVVSGGGGSTEADFDRLVEFYSSGLPPTPSDDNTAPHVYWSRSFPETASIEAGQGPVDLTCYVVDDLGISSLTLNNEVPVNLTKHAENFWSFTATVTENGTLNVIAADSSGNRTTRPAVVDWFNTSYTGTSTAPALTTKFVDETGADIKDYVSKGKSAFINATTTTADTTIATTSLIPLENNGKVEFQKTEVTKDATTGYFPVTGNGFYVVTATAADGTTRTEVLYMSVMDSDIPTVSLSLADVGSLADGQSAALSWSVLKSNNRLSPITEVSINGHKLTIIENQTRVGGTFPIAYGGTYVLTAKDKAGNSNTTTLTVDGLPVTMNQDSLLTLTHSWNQDKNNGSVVVNPVDLTGGTYLESLSNKPENNYKGSYDVLLVLDTVEFDEAALREAQLKEYADTYFALNPDAPKDDPLSIMPEEDLAKIVAAEKAKVYAAWLTSSITDAQADWKLLNSAITISDLAPGNYLVALRDAQDNSNTETAAMAMFTLQNEAISFETTTFRANGYGSATGSVSIDAQGGRLSGGTYQFAIRPLEKKDSPLVDVADMTSPLDQEKFPADKWETPQWQLSDLTSGSLSKGMLKNLKPGWYQIAVRTMEGVSAAQMQNLVNLYATLVAATDRVKQADAGLTPSGLEQAKTKKITAIREALQLWEIAAEADQASAETTYKNLIDNDANILSLLTAWKAIDSNDTEQRDAYEAAKAAYEEAVATLAEAKVQDEADAEKSAADGTLTNAQTAYDALESSLTATADKAYTDDASLWSNATSALIEIGYYSYEETSSGIKPVITEDVVTMVFDNPRQVLSNAEQNSLIGYNKTRDLIFKSPTMYAIIPKGTLTNGDNIMKMLLPFADLPANPSGYVVQYTDQSGKTHIVTFSNVTSGMVSYLAAQPGTYKIVKNAVSFPDVASEFWGADAISFVTARKLFEGNEKGEFQPTAPMTRAMFVTVLGRLAGIDTEKQAQSDFTDVEKGSWYAPFVAWAVENKIIDGYGNNLFGSDDPITREQLCVILVRFLAYMNRNTKTDDTTTQPFADSDTISAWAKDAVSFFLKAGLIQGVGDNKFAPAGLASRAEVATMYQRIICYILAQ